jgi:hypothetical protein
MTTKKPIIRPAYDWSEAQHVAEAADLIAAEAKAEGCEVHRPWNGFMLEGRPGDSAARTLSWWYYQEGKAREENWRKKEDKLEAEIKRLRDLVSEFVDKDDAALKRTKDACQAAYAGGYAAGAAAAGNTL